MLKGVQYWILVAIGAACLIAVVLNTVLSAGNDSHQREIALRNQYIQQSIQLQGLYQDMVRALANMSVRNKDPQLRDLLAKQGINVTVNPASAAPAPASKSAVRGSEKERSR